VLCHPMGRAFVGATMSQLRPGDRVRLLHGESAGIIGIVESVLTNDTVSVLLNRKKVTYCATKDLVFVRRGKAPLLSDALLGDAPQ
jgi:preprotein translocase subunit YajC